MPTVVDHLQLLTRRIICAYMQVGPSLHEVMGSPADLTLGCRPQSSGNEFKAVSTSGDQIERVRKLDEYLKALEDERHKIEAFKRELPHCMQLLDYGQL